ncbi:hypothetical protein Fmac_031903 [Flemingia macrophylla]|uniref:Uncharacterized protein n=1 Tax=Flemingia macrophylla TaxID=520843 RepID=A0ABD1L3E3_9FABA
MANSSSKILSIVLFLTLISQGYSQCSLHDLSITQRQTGAKFEGKAEWSVTITNKCPCVQKNVILNCIGFQSAKTIDPSIFRRVSSRGCLVNAGQPVYADAIKFNYVWDHSFPLNPISSEISCS